MHVMIFVYNFMRIISLYPLLLSCRFLKIFGHQPRLALVTRTLQDSFVDIVHFIVVFFSIFVGFAAIGMCLFGNESPEWTLFSRALFQTYRVMLGEFHWQESLLSSRALAMSWFAFFVLIVMWIMVNMLVGIILETYVSVKEH